MKPIDCHCHLNFDQYQGNLEEVLERARAQLEFVVCPGCDLASNKEIIQLSKNNERFVIPNLGLHPTRTSSFDDLDKIKEQIKRENPPAIGEIGLDHQHVNNGKERAKQKQVFEEMIELAEIQNKPVVVHSREAEGRCIEILAENNLEDVMMHCFNGTVEEAEKAVRKGFKIGVTTQVLYSSRVQQIVETLDIDDILLETDSPFLYPDGINEPVNVVESAQKISEIKNIDKQEVIDKTSSHAINFFR